MKQFDIIRAFNTLEALSNKKITDEAQWNIFKLRKSLLPHVEFFNERLDAIKDRYRPFADENENITGEKFHEFMSEFDELKNMDKELDIKKFTLTLTGETGITAMEMETLDSFIDFEFAQNP